MNYSIKMEEYYINILQSPHTSEKSSNEKEKNNTIILKVKKNSNKKNIKNAIEKIFSIKIKHIRTLIVKGKMIRKGKNIGFSKNWKKAYVSLYKGQNLNLLNFSKDIKKI